MFRSRDYTNFTVSKIRDRIAVADDPNLSQLLDAGQNLWMVKFGTQTNVYQITALTGGANGFPNGAVWSTGGNKLVTAGRIGGVNGLWVIPVSTDGSSCHCQPELLPTLPGDLAGRKKEHDLRALKRQSVAMLRQGAGKGRKVLWVWDKAGVALPFWQERKAAGIYFLSLRK